jgi:hypothetical protein
MAVKGVQQTLNAIRNFQEVIQEDVKDSVEKWTLIILREAINNAPGAGDLVATQHGTQKIETGVNQYISSELVNNGFTGRVFLEAGASLMAIYLEFGTGKSAQNYVPTLPAEWQAFAKKYYINGKGTLIKHPFLLPAFFNNQFKFLYDMQKVLKSHGINSTVIS